MREVTRAPDFILFAQHGWADTNWAIGSLAKTLATPRTKIVVPNLGWLRTWFRIEPLVEQVEQLAIATLSHYPDIPIRIIGHSMGGLIWLEVLSRHPEWWPRVEALVLIASPIGGADLARLIDPLGWGIGIARDLGKNRRSLAEAIARVIPTLIIAGDLDGGSDGTITLDTTQFDYAQSVILPNLPHATLKSHPSVGERIREFWQNPVVTPPRDDLTTRLIRQLRSIPGITDAHRRDFIRAKTHLILSDGIALRLWKHPLQLDHIFVAKGEEQCLYGGFVGWMHNQALRQALEEIEREHL